MLEFLYRRPLVAVIAACLPVLLIGLDHYPAPWLDEGSRYGYLGLFAGLALLGLMVADLAEQASRRMAWTPAVRARLGGALILGFTLAAWMGHVPPALAAADGRDPVGVTRLIDAQVPRDNIIETREWELTSPGAHTNFHHPGQHLLNQAIADQGRGRPYGLQYDLLQADPDYLVTGGSAP